MDGTRARPAWCDSVLAIPPAAAYWSPDNVILLGYCSVDGTLLSVPLWYCCSVDGTLFSVPDAAEYCSPEVEELVDEEDEVEEEEEQEDTLVTVPVAVAVADAVAIGLAYCSPEDGTLPSVPVDGWNCCCSVDGTLVRVPAAYCSADGTLVTALTLLVYCSTEIVLVRLPPAQADPPVPEEPCWCSADGILVRVPKLLAEQLVVIVDVPANATERRFGL